MEALYAWEGLTKPKVAKGLGSASTRTAAQAAAARAYDERIIAQMDPTGLHIYTDGSANPNPGSCGAGVYCSIPQRIDQELSIGLGNGTNNLGELWAIGAAIALADRATLDNPQLRGRKAYIITDSQYAIGCLLQGWTSRHTLNTTIVESIKRMMSTSTLNWHINWTPGHAGVAGNEAADGAADRGALRSVRGEGLTDLQGRARAGLFLPD